MIKKLVRGFWLSNLRSSLQSGSVAGVRAAPVARAPLRVAARATATKTKTIKVQTKVRE